MFAVSYYAWLIATLCSLISIDAYMPTSLLRSSLRMSATALAKVSTKEWTWRGHKICYKCAGEEKNGPATILIHGFGGNADHFRKNTPVLGASLGPTYALDLLGYGFSDKPDPGPWESKNSIYNFETWGDQIADFAREIVSSPSNTDKEIFLVCNSVGGCAGLQASLVGGSSLFKGIILFNISLRMLHTSKQPTYIRPFVKALQYVLRETPIGKNFFGTVATEKTVKNILQQCYGDPATVTDELVDVILQPGLTPGAVKVFLDFISYSGGPLPEELLPKMKVPVLIGWGELDPWEPVEMGRKYADFDCVEDFVTLPGVGHCPQDEAPTQVNKIIQDFVLKHSKHMKEGVSPILPAQGVIA